MFTPWVGRNWSEHTNPIEGRKLLILGESHYESDGKMLGQKYADGTLETFEKYVLGDQTLPFFTKIMQTISGRKKSAMTRDEIRDVWESVVFYNYVPVYVAQGPRESPTNEMFELGVEPFNQIMKQYLPEIVVVCGHRLWWWLLRGQHFIGEPSEIDTFEIGPALALKMQHPSTAFSSEKWHGIIQEHLRQVR
jgi:hypothetical protein